jgi:hypothetical protein
MGDVSSNNGETEHELRILATVMTFATSRFLADRLTTLRSTQNTSLTISRTWRASRQTERSTLLDTRRGSVQAQRLPPRSRADMIGGHLARIESEHPVGFGVLAIFEAPCLWVWQYCRGLLR